MKWLWLALAGLLAVAAGATWYAFHDPVFWTGLVAAIVATLAPILFKRNAEKEREKQEAVRNGLDSLRKRDR